MVLSPRPGAAETAAQCSLFVSASRAARVSRLDCTLIGSSLSSAITVAPEAQRAAVGGTASFLSAANRTATERPFIAPSALYMMALPARQQFSPPRSTTSISPSGKAENTVPRTLARAVKPSTSPPHTAAAALYNFPPHARGRPTTTSMSLPAVASATRSRASIAASVSVR